MKRKLLSIISIAIISCIFMAIVDGIISPTYSVKSFVKILLFLVIPIIYSLFDKEISFKKLFKINKKKFSLACILGIGIYVLILGLYFLLKDVFDFSNITVSLTKNIGVNGSNFIWVSIYISFINSLLEELFFRGFIFLNIKNLGFRKFAYLFSSIIFALYHVAMMVGWFSMYLYILAILGLIIAGIVFNYLNEKNNNIYTSWIVHMFANFAINTIGFMLFNII